ncbi:MAG TPA: hypothetical protein VF656_06250 [Pyrinomonadaceae bacterium]|jgi:hypothetical protein
MKRQARGVKQRRRGKVKKRREKGKGEKGKGKSKRIENALSSALFFSFALTFPLSPFPFSLGSYLMRSSLSMRPSRMGMTRWARSAMSGSCVTTMMVLPSACSFSNLDASERILTA